MMFLLKKIISQFIMPEPFCLIVIMLGLFLIWFTKFQKTAKLIITSGVLLLIIFSYKYTANILSIPLEKNYQPITNNNYTDFKNIKYIVVLGGGVKSGNYQQITNKISQRTLLRLSEGIRLIKLFPNAKLLLSGGKTFSEISEAEIMKSIAVIFGIDSNQIITDSISLDTEQQAKYIKKIIKKNKFLLVTSAIHMSRSLFLFKSLGLNPVPAPTDYNTDPMKSSPYYYFPSPGFLDESTSAIHEYIAFLWLYLKQFI